MFSKKQLELIKFGYDNSLDAEIYSNPEFDEQQMLILLNMLQDKMDAKVYAKKEYSSLILGKIYYILREEISEEERQNKINLLIIEN